MGALHGVSMEYAVVRLEHKQGSVSVVGGIPRYWYSCLDHPSDWKIISPTLATRQFDPSANIEQTLNQYGLPRLFSLRPAAPSRPVPSPAYRSPSSPPWIELQRR